jgi:enamine deaminase RidA (YjgF/YER057c/UK114 family)
VKLERSNPDGVSPPLGTYTHVVKVETTETITLYISGQVPADETGAIVGHGDMRKQTEQVYENLKTILAAHGATFADVVKMNTFVTTLDDLIGMREVRSHYLPIDLPASTAVQIVALVVPEAMIEVDAVAVLARDR